MGVFDDLQKAKKAILDSPPAQGVKEVAGAVGDAAVAAKDKAVEVGSAMAKDTVDMSKLIGKTLKKKITGKDVREGLAKKEED